MNVFSLLLVSSACLVVCASGEERVDVRFISLPVQGVAEVRKVLEDRVQGKELGAFETVLKQKGVKAVGGFFQKPLMGDDKPVNLMEPVGTIGKIGRSTGRSAALQAAVTPMTSGGVRTLAVNTSFDILTSHDGLEYIKFSIDGRQIPVRQGRWEETGCWMEGREAWMAWQYFSGATPVDDAAQADAAAEKSFIVDLVFLKATLGEVKQLAKADVDAGRRDQAVGALLARGPAWRAMRLRKQVGEVQGSMDFHAGQFVDVKLGKEQPAPLYVESTSERIGGVLSLRLYLHLKEEFDGPLYKEKVALEKVTPFWNFVVLEKLGDVKVLAYRGVGEKK
jgi:hypothetical protein